MLQVSTNFRILGAMDQKLWVFEVFRPSLSGAGMCWSQLARVDNLHKKWRARGENIYFLNSFFGKFGEWANLFGRMSVQHSHFLKLVPTFGRAKSFIFMEVGEFIIFPNFFC
jgi:hypothetical protein